MAAFRFLHVGLAVASVDDAARFFETALDHVVVRGPFDDAAQDARVLFLAPRGRDGEPVELVAPLTDGSHVHRLVKRAAGAYHACYEVDVLDDAIASLRAAGATLVSGPTPAVAFDGRRIAWVYTPQRALLELLEAP